MGYHRAGFDVTGVDIKPQKRYPFTFIQADALEFLRDHWQEFDAYAASPPCQAHTALKSMWNSRPHLDLIPQTRDLLRATGKPYVIENVPGAPLTPCMILCGTMFGLRTDCGAELRRHRLFETNWFAGLVPPCAHYAEAVCGVYGGHGRDRRRVCTVVGSTGGTSRRQQTARRPATITVCGDGGGMSKKRETIAGLDGRMFNLAARKQAMGIEWMSGEELSQAIPPAYTEFIGKALMVEICPEY